MNSKMKMLAKKLNLKEHVVGGKLIYLPVDLEAHKGLDGKVYLLDFRCAMYLYGILIL